MLIFKIFFSFCWKIAKQKWTKVHSRKLVMVGMPELYHWWYPLLEAGKIQNRLLGMNIGRIGCFRIIISLLKPWIKSPTRWIRIQESLILENIYYIWRERVRFWIYIIPMYILTNNLFKFQNVMKSLNSNPKTIFQIGHILC